MTDASRPGVGQLYQSPLPIPDYSGDDLMLSDVAFGVPDAEGGWTRRGVSLALLPTSQFPESSFDVYYEVHNLPAGTPYETEISIEPVDEIESALPTGRYLLTVTVRDRVDGRVATRSRPIQVRGWGEGMTMVRALPRVGPSGG